MTTVEITLNDVDYVVTGDYMKPERQFFNPIIGVGHPGREAEFTVCSVEADGADVTDEVRAAGLIPELEVRALEAVEDDK